MDSHLRVLGSQGTIFCLGDAAITAATPKAALPPTAQVARQEGEYLARLLSNARLELVAEAGTEEAGGDSELVPLPEGAKPFRCDALQCCCCCMFCRAVSATLA